MKTVAFSLPAAFRTVFTWLVFGWLGLTWPAAQAQAAHSSILVKDAEAVLAKIRQQPWTRQAFDNLVAQVKPYVQRQCKDPEWTLSRYQMNRAPRRRYTHFYADAAVVYWLTCQEEYAAFAADVLEQAAQSRELPFTKTKAGITFTLPPCSNATISLL